ncbi:MAG TPA: MarR family transcriptional regulator [Sphingomonas sp.]|jgi:DNA-binding MarR family transcriptional regulator|nr:MarR family transcriptional regulator [Sphingomonas sp.]
MSDGIGFLISDVSRLLRRRFDERARLIGVTRPQWRALTMLARHEGLQQGALADLLEVEPITLCRMVDRLAESGLVERRRDPGDRRAWNLYLTDKARPLIDQLRLIADEVFAAALADLPAAEVDHFAGVLACIRSNLSADTVRPEAAHG